MTFVNKETNNNSYILDKPLNCNNTIDKLYKMDNFTVEDFQFITQATSRQIMTMLVGCIFEYDLKIKSESSDSYRKKIRLISLGLKRKGDYNNNSNKEFFESIFQIAIFHNVIEIVDVFKQSLKKYHLKKAITESLPNIEVITLITDFFYPDSSLELPMRIAVILDSIVEKEDRQFVIFPDCKYDFVHEKKKKLHNDISRCLEILDNKNLKI